MFLAHGSAYQKGVMHRDVSAGNVLIFPREYIDEEGTLQVDRDGMLTDWELSKDVEEKPGAKSPRQPDRTVRIASATVSLAGRPNNYT